MSDHLIQSDQDGDRMGRPSMHLYQSIWMAHWTQTSFKPEIQGHIPMSLHCEYKEDDSDARQYRPEITPDISKSAKGFEDVSESRTVDMMNDNLKLNSIKSGKERFKGRFFPKFSVSQKRKGIMDLKDITTRPVVVSELGTLLGQHHFQPEALSEDLKQQMNSHESLVKNGLAVSTSLQPDVGSSSKIMPYRYNSGKSPLHSFVCHKDEINQLSPFVASKDHLTHTKFQSYSTSLVHDKKTKNLSDFRRSGTPSLRQNVMPLLLHDPSAGNNRLPVLVDKQCEKMQNHSCTRLLPNFHNPSDAKKSEIAFHGFCSVPRVSRSLQDVETMRICTTVDSMKELSAVPPKFSHTTHHFMITKRTDVNLSEGDEMFRDSSYFTNMKGKMLSKFLSFSPGFGCHDQQGLKLQPLESFIDSEEKEKFGDVKTSAVCLKNESSAETDTMDMDIFKNNHSSAVVSSPTNKIIDWCQTTSQAAIASPREDTGGRLTNIELPDINEELPALPAGANLADDKDTSPSRTQSLDAENLFSHAVLPTNSNFGVYPAGHMESEPSSRWVKRLKLSASDLFAHGTKICRMEEASCHEKVNKFVSKIMRCGITSPEHTMGKSPGKDPVTQDQTAGLLRNGESSSTESVRKTRDLTLLNPWIKRWCRHAAASPKQNHEPMVACEPRISNATLNEFPKKQFPSLAAMAMMGKALNRFQQCQFRRSGSYIIWNT